MSQQGSNATLENPDPACEAASAGAGDAIVISGAAMITCLGADRETTWRAVLEGRPGMGPLTALEQPLPPGKDGGQAVDLPSDDTHNDTDATAPREVRYLRRAIRDALADAHLLSPSPLYSGGRAGVGGSSSTHGPYPRERCGVLLGTTLHGIRAGGEYLRGGNYDALRQFLASSTLRNAGRDLAGFGGIAATTCSACSSSLGSIALAVTLLRRGELDLVLAGGYDPVSEYVYGGFNSLRLVAEGPLRPFARGRSGMKLAEGYGVVVLERESAARRRGIAKPFARVLGYGESADAHHLTQPHPQGDGAARAVEAALKSAGLRPDQIDLVAAHATGTPDNDAGEYAALSRALGDSLPRTPVVGFKSHLGHTLGAAGVVELILSALALRDGVVPPCASVRPEDVEFPNLNLATGAPRTAPLRATLNTSLGFGGANTCVILGAPDETERPSPSPLYPGERAGVRGLDASNAGTGSATKSPSPRPSPLSTGERGKNCEVFITGVGVVLPGAIGNEAFAARLTTSNPTRITRDTGPIGDEPIMHLLNARRVRRMSEYVKLSLAATTVAFADAGITDIPAFAATCSAVLGSTHGSANYSAEYYGQIVREGINAANPLLFAEGVPNAAAAHLSLMLSLKGACQTIIGTRTAGLDALRLAAARIAAGEWDRAVVSAGEEFSPVVNDAYRHCGLGAPGEGAGPFAHGNGFVVGCGAATFVLESRASLESRSLTAADGSPRVAASPRGTVESWSAASSFTERRDEPESAARVLCDLGAPRHVVSSANGTWIDRAEAAAVRYASRHESRHAPRHAGRPEPKTNNLPPPVVSSVYGHIAETFSVGPLAAAAAVLLTGRLPPLFGPAPAGLAGAAASERTSSFAVLCTDYAGLVSGCRVGVSERAAA